MKNELTAPVYKFLEQQAIYISKRNLSKKLSVHPDYPSLTCITDFLDEIGLENGAYEVDKSKWKELPYPFLAHTNEEGGYFFLVNQEDKAGFSKSDKFEKWDGIVVYAEKPNNWMNIDNLQELKKEKFEIRLWIWCFISMSVLAFLSILHDYDFLSGGLLLVTLTGVVVAVTIAQKELGIDTKISEKFCEANSLSDCNAVMQSGGNRITDYFNWSDAGVIYFISFLLLQLSNTQLLPVLSVIAIPFTLFSVYYQWRIVRRWCPLCLIIVAALWIQLLLQLPVLLSLSLMGITVPALAYIVFILVGIAMVWRLLKHQLIKVNKTEKENHSLLRFKNSSDVFTSLLSVQRKVDTTCFDNEVQFGDPKSFIQVLVACNPFCQPCAIAHDHLKALAENNTIGLAIRFCTPDSLEDKRTIAATHLLSVALNLTINERRRLLHYWYTTMDIGLLQENYPTTTDQQAAFLLKHHNDWAKANAIHRTPTVFINGFELPSLYNVKDLDFLLRALSKKAAQKKFWEYPQIVVRDTTVNLPEISG